MKMKEKYLKRNFNYLKWEMGAKLTNLLFGPFVSFLTNKILFYWHYEPHNKVVHYFDFNL